VRASGADITRLIMLDSEIIDAGSIGPISCASGILEPSLIVKWDCTGPDGLQNHPGIQSNVASEH
jgi:hypothetical protein